MSKFTTKIIIEVSVTRKVFKLFSNNKCQFDEFFKKNKSKTEYSNQLGQIQSILKYIGNDEIKKLPISKFKQLSRDKKDNYIDFEIRTKDFRVYLFVDKELGHIIVMGGFKKNQKKELPRFRQIKKQYFNSK